MHTASSETSYKDRENFTHIMAALDQTTEAEAGVAAMSVNEEA